MISYFAFPGTTLTAKFQAPMPSREDIIDVVLRHCNMPFQRLETKSRNLHLVKARRFIWHFLRLYSNTTLKQAGEMFNRDHTTVVHSLQTLEVEMSVNESLRKEVMDLQQRIKRTAYVAANTKSNQP